MLLGQVVRRLGGVGVPVPGPAVPWLSRVLPAGAVPPRDQVPFLAHGRVVSTARAHGVLGVRPRSTARVVDELAATLPPGRPLDVALAVADEAAGGLAGLLRAAREHVEQADRRG